MQKSLVSYLLSMCIGIHCATKFHCHAFTKSPESLFAKTKASKNYNPKINVNTLSSNTLIQSKLTSSLLNSNGGSDPLGTGQITDQEEIFSKFAAFLLQKQTDIIAQLESMDENDQTFSKDVWGSSSLESTGSGGITRVIQKGSIIEKGACSITIIRDGILSKERASSIQGRQDEAQVQEGDRYSAAALSIVFHSRSPMVPTFRSDVRIFLVQSQSTNQSTAWFGGGADLTPYYLFDDDVKSFHSDYQNLCHEHFQENDQDGEGTYREMKKMCDDYFYLPARAEHRGTGGIFFDDMMATSQTLSFVQSVANAWMPSWIPIVEKRHSLPYTEKQREWQLLRRGRYLEFNLLYDRGVKFGLAVENPRVEGVMVSAPPLIAWEYRHEIEEGSEEERLMKILKAPIDWV